MYTIGRKTRIIKILTMTILIIFFVKFVFGKVYTTGYNFNKKNLNVFNPSFRTGLI